MKQIKLCEDSIKYINQFDTYKEAWENCQRSDWMCFLILCRTLNKEIKTTLLNIKEFSELDLFIDHNTSINSFYVSNNMFNPFILGSKVHLMSTISKLNYNLVKKIKEKIPWEVIEKEFKNIEIV